jgi:enamine deaminase RidA (YjgF/YER057c/UK114 family)
LSDVGMKPLDPPTIWPVPEQFRTIYSHAIDVPAGRTLYISGQVGVTPNGSVAADFAGQCEQAMNNVEALLTAAGMTTANIVKLSYFLIRSGDLSELGQIRRRRWASATPPAVTVLVVAGLARPDYLVEIEAIAASSSTERRTA